MSEKEDEKETTPDGVNNVMKNHVFCDHVYDYKETIEQLKQIIAFSEPHHTKIRVKFKVADGHKFDIRLPEFMLVRDKTNEHWVQRIENEMYGVVITYGGQVIPSYPHLRNFLEDKFKLQRCIAETKMNGTNIAICEPYSDTIIRTRTRLNPTDFPVPTYFNETINNICDDKIRDRLKSDRDYVLKKYPDWFLNECDCEYIGLKPVQVARHIFKDSLFDKKSDASKSLSRYCYFFELMGKINPIIVEGEVKYGQYDFDYKMILFDVWDMQEYRFLNRDEKSKLAAEYNLELVEQLFKFDTKEDTIKAVEMLRKYSDEHLIEGFVVKDDKTRIKVKSEKVLSEARRSLAIMKGRIHIDDMLNYVAKVVSAEYLKKPDEFNTLVDMMMTEALADYPKKIVNYKKPVIQQFIADKMAIFAVDEIMNEKKWSDKAEMFRYINTELPLRFKPLKDYIDYETEKNTEDKKLRKEMKKRRTLLFGKITTFCMKRMRSEGDINKK